MIKFLDLKKINQLYNEEIHSAVNRVIDSGWYLFGEEVRNFENNYAGYIGTDYCVGVGNGLDALRLILRSYIECGEMEEGDEIIVPTNTYIATILAITANNLTPVLVEPDIDTFQIDPTKIEQSITSKSKAILIVHLYGKCAFTREIGKICEKHDLKLIEDNAQAAGCTTIEGKTGSLGEIAAHSFYPGKNIGALGDAGAITTNNKILAETARTLANYGSSKKYIFDFGGINSRMSEINAAVLNVKLKYLDRDNLLRKQMARFYFDKIKHPDIKLPFASDIRDNVFHVFPVLTQHRNELQEYLTLHKVETMIHYPIPPHKQKAFKFWNNLSYPVTEKIHDEELSLPLNQSLTMDDINTITEITNKWVI